MSLMNRIFLSDMIKIIVSIRNGIGCINGMLFLATTFAERKRT